MKLVDRSKKQGYNCLMNEKNGDVPAISKMNLIFNLLSTEYKGLSQTTICNRLNLPKATVFRLMNTLHSMGYLEHNSNTGTYTLGAKLLTLGNIVNTRLDLNTNSLPFLEDLSESVGEMVKLTIMRGDVVYPIQSVESKKAIRITLDTGTVYQPYNGAAGKLLLAMTTEGENYVKNTLPEIEMVKFTANTITDPKLLLKELKIIKDQGYSQDNQEESEGIYAIAAPVYNFKKEVIAAVSVPFFGNFIEKRDKYLPILLSYTKEISRSMGYIDETVKETT